MNISYDKEKILSSMTEVVKQETVSNYCYTQMLKKRTTLAREMAVGKILLHKLRDLSSDSQTHVGAEHSGTY